MMAIWFPNSAHGLTEYHKYGLLMRGAATQLLRIIHLKINVKVLVNSDSTVNVSEELYFET